MNYIGICIVSLFLYKLKFVYRRVVVVVVVIVVVVVESKVK